MWYDFIQNFVGILFRKLLSFISNDCNYYVNKRSGNLIFYIESRRYVIRFPIKRGPCNILKVTTNDINKNVTKEIFEYMGPYHNFYGIPTTPEILGYPNGLKFYMMDDLVLSFDQNDIIDI